LTSGSYVRSTDEVGAPSRFAYWREAICDSYVPLEPECGADRFRGRIDGIQLADFHGSEIRADAHRVSLTREGMARQQRSPFFANLVIEGEAAVSQGGAQGVARAGDVYIVDCSSPWEVGFPSPFRMFCIEIDEDVLRPRLGTRGRLELPVIGGGTGAGKILARYMALLRELPPGDLLPMQSLVTNHCTELLARAQAAQVGGTPAERIRRDLLERVHGFIERHLDDSSLGPESACLALRVSRSYLFKVLAESGVTFGACLRERRLQAARRALRESPTRQVADVAAAVGYSDPTSFSRAYRQRFGEAPGSSRTRDRH